MAIKTYLAMTAAEFESTSKLPESIAWMACHFSPYATGISNVPPSLPENSLLILNDITPIHNHDPEIIGFELRQCIEKLHCCAVLLDFQRLPDPELNKLTEHLIGVLPCPAVLPESLALQFHGPVFLPPCPLYTPLQEHIQNWKDREIWLEIANNPSKIVINKHGTHFIPDDYPESYQKCYTNPKLNCHYTVAKTLQDVTFHLWRIDEDWKSFLNHAHELGISNFVGLYQEFTNTL